MANIGRILKEMVQAVLKNPDVRPKKLTNTTIDKVIELTGTSEYEEYVRKNREKAADVEDALEYGKKIISEFGKDALFTID
jgi:alkyl hydroperoxide reductase subunit AhpF